MNLTKVQKTIRFIVYRARDLIVLSFITGILPALMVGHIYQILGI